MVKSNASRKVFRGIKSLHEMECNITGFRTERAMWLIFLVTIADKLYRISTLFSTISHKNLTPEGILIHTIIHYIPALYRSFFVLYIFRKKKIKIRNVCMYVDLAEHIIKSL